MTTTKSPAGFLLAAAMEKHTREVTAATETKRKYSQTTDVEVVNLCDDEDGDVPACTTQTPKRARMTESAKDKVPAMTTPQKRSVKNTGKTTLITPESLVEDAFTPATPQTPFRGVFSNGMTSSPTSPLDEMLTPITPQAPSYLDVTDGTIYLPTSPVYDAFTPNTPKTPFYAASGNVAVDLTSPIEDAFARGSPKSPTGTDSCNNIHSPRSPVEATSPIVGATAEGITSPCAMTYSLPTPNATPQKNKALYAISELADRYVPEVSTVEGVVYKDPKNFSIKPAFWKKWQGIHYAKFAEHLRLQFDPIPFARESGLAVEEINQVFSGLVCNPLYFAVEAQKRGEEGMGELMDLYNNYGTPMRPWGKAEKGAKKVQGELHNVQAGAVDLILENGSKGEMKLSEMSEVDIKYLKQTLMPLDKQKLWETSGEMAAFGPDGILL